MKSLQDQGSDTKFSYKDLEMLILPTLILLLTRLTLSELKIYRWVRKKNGLSQLSINNLLLR